MKGSLDRGGLSLQHCCAAQHVSLTMDDKSRELIATHLGVARSRVLDPVTFRELGADSLDLISLTMAFEEHFDLAISAADAETCACVGDAIALLYRRMNELTLPALADMRK
jgi:acyl carrier protein